MKIPWQYPFGWLAFGALIERVLSITGVDQGWFLPGLGIEAAAALIFIFWGKHKMGEE